MGYNCLVAHKEEAVRVFEFWSSSSHEFLKGMCRGGMGAIRTLSVAKALAINPQLAPHPRRWLAS